MIVVWQIIYFNFYDIDENVLKLDILGYDDFIMICKFQDLLGIDLLNIFLDDLDVMKLFFGMEVLGVIEE